jgi:hypothetical protein
VKFLHKPETAGPASGTVLLDLSFEFFGSPRRSEMTGRIGTTRHRVGVLGAVLSPVLTGRWHLPQGAQGVLDEPTVPGSDRARQLEIPGK